MQQVICSFCYHSAFLPCSRLPVPIPITFLELDSTSEWRKRRQESQRVGGRQGTLLFTAELLMSWWKSDDPMVTMPWAPQWQYSQRLTTACSWSAFHYNSLMAGWWSWEQTNPSHETQLPEGLSPAVIALPRSLSLWSWASASCHFPPRALKDKNCWLCETASNTMLLSLSSVWHFVF